MAIVVETKDGGFAFVHKEAITELDDFEERIAEANTHEVRETERYEAGDTIRFNYSSCSEVTDESKKRSLRDVLKSGEICPYCRSEDVADRRESDLDAEEFDYLCRDCGFLWKADGVDVTPPTKPIPNQV